MEIKQALEMAKTAGYEVAEPMDPQSLVFRSEVRDMCATDKCRQYDKRWTCPPACGALEEMEGRYKRFQNGVLVQSICRMDDEFDLDAWSDMMKTHRGATEKLLDLIGESSEEIVPFGSDGCGKCEKCTYPDEPCRFPGHAFPSLEACGIVVSDLCKSNNVPYYYGKNTVAFTGAFLFNPRD